MDSNSAYRSKFFEAIFKEGQFEKLVTKEEYEKLINEDLNTFMDNLCKGFLNTFLDNARKGLWNNILIPSFPEIKKLVIERAKIQISLLKENPVFLSYEQKIAS